ncbi:cytochrome B562 [[Pasteurella] aerogenes]|nr:cytochrome b562 [[Pasteurella] aerogenes]MCU9998250.1 cytochrome B562 [[Pasteurella] aerogenes]MDY4479801.1 cytochrome b562 [[Pasteurella] aerogenes]MDY4595422.1 cytochrome b562 [[Pasteurella] aerogenes]UWZ93323.1 cytochrome B562 [[Pasteurella] aerogenes]
MLKFKHILSVALLALATNVMADVGAEMSQMNRQVKALNNATSAEEFTQSSDKFLAAANKAKVTMPDSLNGDQEKFKGYQQGIQQVIDVVEQAKGLAAKGKLDEAKNMVQGLDALKKRYHKEYKK